MADIVYNPGAVDELQLYPSDTEFVKTETDPLSLHLTGGTMTGGLTTALVVNDKDANNILTIDSINNRVGIGTTSPAYKLDVAGDVNITGAYRVNGTAIASGVGGSGTANYIPIFATGSTLGNSAIYQTGGNVGIGTTAPGAKLEINQTAAAVALSINANGQDSGSAVFNVIGVARNADRGSGKAFTIVAAGETYATGVFYSDGAYGIGPGGSSGRDIFIDRSAANTLRVSSNAGTGLGNLVITGNVGIGTTGPGKLLSVGANLWQADVNGIVWNNNAKTTYNGSVSGTAVWSQPFQGSAYKKFIIYLAALNDVGGTITFPTAFSHTPVIYGTAASLAICTASTTTFTIGAAATITGYVICEGD